MDMHTLMAYADVIEAAQTNAQVGRLIDGHVFVGTARSVGTEDGYFARSGADVSELFLRVTLSGGTDAYWPMAELAEERRTGMFVPDYSAFPRVEPR